MADINLNPYTAESESIAKKRRLAELLQQQSLQPIEMPQQAGVPISPYSGLAKLLNAYVGTKKEQEAVTEQKNLAQQYQKDVATDLASIFRDMRAPAQPGMVMGDDTMQGARPAGYLDPANLQAMKTPIGQQTYMAQLLAKPEAPIKASAGDVFFDPRTKQEIFRAPEKSEFGTTPQYEKDDTSPTGFVSVLYGKNGERKVVGPANPVNQFTTITKDTEATIKQRREDSDRNFNQLSAYQRAQLENDAKRLGISAQQLFFDTGIKAGGGAFVNPLAQPPAQPNAPVVAPRVPTTPVAGAPVANAPPTSTSSYTPFSNVNAQANDLVLPPKFRLEQMKNAPGQENTLRDEFNTLTRDFRTVQDAHSKIKSVANTGAGDMSLLYSYVKLLDPGSVVRESDFATAAA